MDKMNAETTDMAQMNIEKNNEYFRIIKKALEEHKLAFFVGSGVSRASAPNNTYPLWSDILKRLQSGLVGCDDSDPLKIAQLYALKYGPLKLKETVKDCFPKKDVPSDIQRSILELRPHCIITTNWDCLFENCVNEEINYIYDIVACDSELIESRNDNKIIKMHGDFHHNNYVFTEDDYLNYSRNFPLIENYIKSIVSTHTIVMIGYSFSDIDLKQIVNWFQNHSSVQPPIYMIDNKYDEYREKYLGKFGINTIVVEYDDRTESLKNFLKKLAAPIESSQDPIEYVYNEIRKYDGYYVALQENIRDSLKNSEILYDSKKRGILHFHEFSFREKEDEKRKNIYQNFIRQIDKDNEDLHRIYNILSKANIVGIVTNLDENKNYKYTLFMDSDVRNGSPVIDFDFSIKKENDDVFTILRNILCYRELGLIEEAFEGNKRLISLCKRRKNYIYLLIGFFNHNCFLHHLKFYPKSNVKIEEEKFFSINEEYSYFPKDIQKDCSEIKNFLTLLDLYKFQFDSFKKAKEREKQVRIIENGGKVFFSNENQFESELQNLIDFILGNGICVDGYSVYRELCKNYITIAFLRQRKEKDISLSKIDLFVCIKYYKIDELMYLFNDFRKKENRKELVLTQPLLNWLVDVALKNCANHFIDRLYNIFGDNLDCYIEKILFLLSLNRLSDELYEKIWDILNRLVNDANNTFAIFSAINSFFAVQWNLYSKSFEEKQIITLLENLLNKFIRKKMNGHEETALSWNRIYNLYNCCKNLKSKFTSEIIIQNVIQAIGDYSEKEKMEFMQNVLLELYQISNNKCQNIIKQYIVKQKFKKPDDFGQFINVTNYYLDLIALNIKKNKKEICKWVEMLINKYPENMFYSSIRLTVDILEFLKKDRIFVDVYEKLKSKVGDALTRFQGF